MSFPEALSDSMYNPRMISKNPQAETGSMNGEDKLRRTLLDHHGNGLEKAAHSTIVS